MRGYKPSIMTPALVIAFVVLVGGIGPLAQRPQKPAPEKQPTIPTTITLADRARLGRVTFNHVKHNGGEYNADGPILCIQCHHTAQPAADLIAIPPHRTVWPAGRTTTLTAELFAEDPKQAGVAACRDCHARPGFKPKLLDAIPVINDPETGSETKITNRVAFHTACDVCHFEIGFRTTGSKAPKANNCTNCHKPEIRQVVRPKRRG